MLINGIGAVATGLTTCVVIVAKFTEGAWISVLAIPGFVLLMYSVHRHYETIFHETESARPRSSRTLHLQLLFCRCNAGSRVAEKALRFAYTLSQEVLVLPIVPEDDTVKRDKDDVVSVWDDYIEKPAVQAGFEAAQLVLLRSPYRLLIRPIFQYILELERKHPERLISVVVPEIVERRWSYYLLHNQRAAALKVVLFAKGDGRIIVVNVPWYLPR
jgi:hypothetical protein